MYAIRSYYAIDSMLRGEVDENWAKEHHDLWYEKVTGKTADHDDDDHRGECFRVYKDAEQSFRDHSEFLTTRSRYDFLFNYSSTDTTCTDTLS